MNWWVVWGCLVVLGWGFWVGFWGFWVGCGGGSLACGLARCFLNSFFRACSFSWASTMSFGPNMGPCKLTIVICYSFFALTPLCEGSPGAPLTPFPQVFPAGANHAQSRNASEFQAGGLLCGGIDGRLQPNVCRCRSAAKLGSVLLCRCRLCRRLWDSCASGSCSVSCGLTKWGLADSAKVLVSCELLNSSSGSIGSQR